MSIISKTLENKPEIQKEAMAVPEATGRDAELMKAHGLYIVQDMLARMPNTTQADMYKALEEIKSSGVSDFFQTMDAKTVISLPAIYIRDPRDVFQVDGQDYISIMVVPPKEIKVKWTSPITHVTYEKAKPEKPAPLPRRKKGEPKPPPQPKPAPPPPNMYSGEVLALNLDTGKPVVFPFDQIKDKITMSKKNSEVTLKKLNARVDSYNKKIRLLHKYLGASKLVLQIRAAESEIATRLADIKGIMEGTQEELDYLRTTPKAVFESYMNNLRERLKRGELNIKDAYDTVLYIFQGIPEQLIKDIDTLNLPADIKAGVLQIAKTEAASNAQKAQDEKAALDARKTNIETGEIPEIHDTSITPFTPEDLPGLGEGANYKEMRKTRTIWSHIKGLEETLKTESLDASELTKIQQDMQKIRQYLGALVAGTKKNPGQRSRAFLNTPAGKPILDAMEKFLGDATAFIRRYAVDIINNGKVNTRLLGQKKDRSSTEGNAVVAIALTGLYNVVKETIDMYTGGDDGGGGTPAVKEPVDAPTPTPAPVAAPVASVQDKIKRMSELLWIPFADRMRLK